MRPSNAERWLAGLDPIGWRFGLERIEAVLAELGHPQRAFASAHVVGTNGKSSVAAMTAAILEQHGRSTGVYLSPHESRWAQRVMVRGAEVDGHAFGAAAARVAEAVERVEPRLPEDERITQFEAATAVAFVALADAGVEFGVIEAGLGGRLDATNVLDSSVTALTSIGLDHTQWLGETELEIAGEKLAVLKPGSALVVGRLSDEVFELARTTARERGARLIEAVDAPASAELDSPAPYLRRNLAVAIELARELLGGLDAEAVSRAATAIHLAGRSELFPGKPPLYLDAAHNPAGAAALAEALAARPGDEPVVACVAILADKDAAGIVAALAPVLDAAVCCEIPADEIAGSGRPGSASIPAEELAAAWREHGVEAEACAGPEEAIALAVARARERDGVALLTGSHYLLGYAWIAKRAQSSSR